MVALSKTSFSVDVLQGYLAGLTLSTAGSSATFGVAQGVAADSTALAMMRLPSAFTKTTSAWAVGTGNGSLDTGSIANSTWYHVYLIARPDTGLVDILISLNATTPTTLPTNYTLFRRVGSMKTNGSAQWTKFVQKGDTFLWDAPLTTSYTSSTSQQLLASNSPLGVKNQLLFSLFQSSAQNGTSAVYDPDIAFTSGAGNATGNVRNATSTTMQWGGWGGVFTNTSAQVATICDVAGATNCALNTQGWVDRRGRDD